MLVDVIALFPFHLEQTQRRRYQKKSHHASSTHGPTTKSRCKPSAYLTFSGRRSRAELRVLTTATSEQPEQSGPVRNNHNYICSAPDSALSNPPSQTTPCYEFIKKPTTLQPFISVSRVCRKPEPRFQCTGWLALYHLLSFPRSSRVLLNSMIVVCVLVLAFS